ncbi:Holliday junction branch migration protein RuvA [Corynebacterium sp. SCR221107]|uniref:Holliday junction branch migration protein RuvA n=1 Tax=Corynebacterium sp. SCR221107 TaxID=3017361 RepID=UPI0022EC34B7|nr:Holliday junction branch migration protein RuvA [Corynebacterium sp. SCR221107]WBT07807.1 Holliday junction branch migration protein RuvA [Corynebacterium sp. SCR221107]
MIVSLRGVVIEIGLGSAVIECNGVGYEVLATPATLAQLHRGEEAFMLTQQVIREDSNTLYGFDSVEARAMFMLLQTVSGLGPRLAMAAQAVYSSQDLSTFIHNGDAQALQKIPGVGKRMAERLIVDLKDKVDAVPETATPARGVTPVATSANEAQVIEALVGLGFREKEAAATVAAVVAEDPSLSTGAVLRKALNLMGSR